MSEVIPENIINHVFAEDVRASLASTGIDAHEQALMLENISRDRAAIVSSLARTVLGDKIEERVNQIDALKSELTVAKTVLGKTVHKTKLPEATTDENSASFAPFSYLLSVDRSARLDHIKKVLPELSPQAAGRIKNTLARMGGSSLVKTYYRDASGNIHDTLQAHSEIHAITISPVMNREVVFDLSFTGGVKSVDQLFKYLSLVAPTDSLSETV